MSGTESKAFTTNLITLVIIWTDTFDEHTYIVRELNISPDVLLGYLL